MSTERVTDAELDEIERLDGEATPEPWTADGPWVWGPTGSEAMSSWLGGNCAFAAAARGLLPRLAAEVRALRAALQDRRDEHAAEVAEKRRITDLLTTAAGEAARLKQREADIIEACERVADGGQYRADIIGAINRIRRERDDARALSIEGYLANIEALLVRRSWVRHEGGWILPSDRDMLGPLSPLEALLNEANR